MIMKTPNTAERWRIANGWILQDLPEVETANGMAVLPICKLDESSRQYWPLLASAPALLAALQMLVKMTEDGDITTVELDEARAAINRAKGSEVGE